MPNPSLDNLSPLLRGLSTDCFPDDEILNAYAPSSNSQQHALPITPLKTPEQNPMGKSTPNLVAVNSVANHQGFQQCYPTPNHLKTHDQESQPRTSFEENVSPQQQRLYALLAHTDESTDSAGSEPATFSETYLY